MQDFFERRSTGLNTSLPSVRLVQDLIRSRVPVSITLLTGAEFEGTFRWQDDDYFALRQDDNLPLVLISRAAVAVIRALS